MGRISKRYHRQIKDQLGRFSNWPVNQKLELGKVGIYHGRRAKVEWVTSLEELGIRAAAQEGASLLEELYTSMGAVSVDFSSHGNGIAYADFNFSKKTSIVTQGYGMNHEKLHIAQLQKVLRERVDDSPPSWDHQWVILTELWTAKGFSTLISGTKGSTCQLSATIPLADQGFNIADRSLGLQLKHSSKMAYLGIAEEEVQPFFQLHRFTKGGVLKVYG